MLHDNITKYLEALSTDLIPTDKVIGVMISGGFDSTVLWHTIYGECLKRNQECRPFTIPKVDGAITYSNRMLEWSCDHYNRKAFYPYRRPQRTRVVGYVDWTRDQSVNPFDGPEVAAQGRSGVKEVLDEGYADIVYSGSNPYPPDYEKLSDFHTPGPRNKSSETPWAHIIKQPFEDLDMTKDQLVELAHEMGWLDDISAVTHSCTEKIRGRCGYCFWCKEREWAFKVTGHKDTGIN